MSLVIQPSLLAPTELPENQAFLEQQLITYIGNKRTLLPFIGKGLENVKRKIGRDKLRVLDLFSGTGVVARYMKQHATHIIANDLETYSYITNQCYLTNRSIVNFQELLEAAKQLRHQIQEQWKPGFITELYSPQDENNINAEDRVFYTRRNAIFLDTARKAIAILPAEIQKYFLAPLLSKASVHANTSGVFKGFYKSTEGVGQFGGNGKDALTRILGEIDIVIPVLSNYECSFEVHQGDANRIVGELDKVDIAYLDPPYNQHPYGSNYFMLNLLCNYQRPVNTSRVSGIPNDWNRSRYNQKQEAEKALFEVISKCNARFIMISYNSEGFIPHKNFVDGLTQFGELTVLETPYNTFRGSRNLRERPLHVTEFMYLLDKGK